MKNQNGFTLIELVVVIVVLGILSAIAVPKFIDLRGDARDASVKGIAGGLASASAINYAAKVTNKDSAVSTAAGCTNTVAENLTNGFSTDDYSLNDTAFGTDPELGDTITCTVTDADDANYTATFDLIYVSVP